MIEQKKKFRLDELQVESFVTTSGFSRRTIRGGDDVTEPYDYYTRNFTVCSIGTSALCGGIAETIENCNAATLDPDCIWTENVCTQSPEICYPPEGLPTPE
ncbi:MAG: hypothetical protein H9535_08320 [Ignavibacteria bacterium]|nr:hypothetical protein [Ignavibacteria bacterium]